MKLVKFEFYKLFNKRLFIMCLLLFLTANIIALFYTQSNDLETNILHENISDYESIISDIGDMPTEQIGKELESMLKVTEIALRLDNFSDNEDVDELDRIEGFLAQYKSENPEEYALAQQLDLSRDELLDRQTYLSELVNQNSYINSYDSFINEMGQRAQQQLKFAIFAEKGSFSYNNIQKTPTDFQKLDGIQLEMGNNLAVENSTAFVLTDLLVFALIFLMCFYLFTFERDRELYVLIRTSKKGRMPIIISKLTVLIIVTILISVMYYSLDVVICGMYSGFGDLTRSIQSIELFMNCNLHLQIWQYLILWCFSKLVTMCIVALLLALVFVTIKNTAMIFIVTAIVVLAEGFMYLSIGGNSLINQLKYINFFYFLSGNNIFGNYLNINFFSQPVNISVVYIMTMALFAIISIIVICNSFVKSSQFTRKNIFMSIAEKVRARFSNISGSVSVFKGECFKHYKCSMAVLPIVLLVLIACYNISDDITVVYSSAQESAYNAYMNELEGELTQEKEDFLQEQKDYFDSLNKEQNMIAVDTTLSSEEKDMKIMAIESILKTKGAAFSEISQQTLYIKDVGERLNITPVFINNIVYKKLVENPTREWQYFTLLMAVIIFVSSNVFAVEHRKHMINLISCTQKGKSKLVLVKVFIVLMTTIISYILIYLPYYVNFIKTFGVASFDSPIVFMQDFSNIGSTISINEMIFITATVHIVTAVTVMLLVVMLSQILKNSILSMIVASVIVLFPCVLCMTLWDVRLYTAFQNGSWKWFVPSLLIVFIFVLILCFIVTLCSFSKVNLKAIGRCKNEA